MGMLKKSFGSMLLAGVLIGCSSPKDYKTKVQNPEFIHRSIKEITDLIVHDIFSPPVASRIYAYSSVAAYEALIPLDKNYKSLAGQLHGLEAVPKPDSS